MDKIYCKNCKYFNVSGRFAQFKKCKKVAVKDKQHPVTGLIFIEKTEVDYLLENENNNCKQYISKTRLQQLWFDIRVA